MATRTRKTPTRSQTTRRANAKERPARVRYAVVGQGYISQVAVLPAFANARRNCELVALVSDDPQKLRASCSAESPSPRARKAGPTCG